MKINSAHVAVAELLMALVVIRSGSNSKGLIKTGLYATGGYLILGAYLNSQGRVKLLPPN